VEDRSEPGFSRRLAEGIVIGLATAAVLAAGNLVVDLAVFDWRLALALLVAALAPVCVWLSITLDLEGWLLLALLLTGFFILPYIALKLVGLWAGG
jgi:hypothetical protein